MFRQAGTCHQAQESPGDDDGRQHADHHADEKCQAETLHRPAEGDATTHQDKNNADNHSGDIAVPNSCPGAVEPGLNGGAECPPPSELFFHPLEDEHVGIHGHTQ